MKIESWKSMDKNNDIQTITSLKSDLKRIGIKEEMTLIVHSSLNSIGWVSGGALTLIQAIQETITNQGTLIMPSHSTDLSDPKDWINPKANKNLWEIIRKDMPAFDPQITPTYGLGVVPELFRTLPNVKRSNHPAYSFSAWGKEKDYILNNHSLNNGLGEESPLARIYDLNGYVLLLGTDYDSNTSMHLSEHRVGVFPRTTEKSPVIYKNKKRWVTYNEIEYDETNFIQIGSAFEKKQKVNTGMIGKAPSKLMNQKKLIDFTTENILQIGRASCREKNIK